MRIKINRKNKKGGIMWQIIIPLIILVVTGAILFFFLGAIPFKETVDREACHQSVLLRSQQFLFLKPGQILGIPLRCKTEEIVISTIDEEQIKRDIANSLYDCWWMLGRGEMNFFSRGWTKDTYCVLCSTIEFDEKTQESISQIEQFDQYLIETKVVSKDFTYAQFLTSEETPQINKQDDPIIDTSKKYAVSYAMIEKTAAPARVTGIAAGIVGVYLGFRLGGAQGALLGGTLLAGLGGLGADYIQNLIEGTNADYYVALELVPLEAQALKDFGCTSIESVP